MKVQLWRQLPLGQLATFVNGRAFKPTDWGDAGRPIIRIQNLNGSSEFNYYAGEADERHVARSGELLFSWSGSVGTSFGPFWWNGPDAVVNQHIFRVLPTQLTDTAFLYHALVWATRSIERNAHGSAGLVHVTKRELERFTLPVPPLTEQRRIAEILGAWDEAIALVERRLAAARERKRGLAQRLLTGQVRFPGFTEPWREVRLGEVATVVMGQSPSSEFYNYEGEGLPLLQGNADMVDRKSSPRQFTTEITQRCEAGDILLSVRAPVGETGRATMAACLGRGMCAIRARKSDQEFLYHKLLHDEWRWQTYAQGSTFTAINGSDIRSFTILVAASSKEQHLIAEFLGTCDDEQRALLAKLAALRTQKRGLMQRLLTGEVRVKV